MREKERLYEAAYNTAAPLYVSGIPAENLLDKIVSWDDRDDREDSLPARERYSAGDRDESEVMRRMGRANNSGAAPESEAVPASVQRGDWPAAPRVGSRDIRQGEEASPGSRWAARAQSDSSPVPPAGVGYSTGGDIPPGGAYDDVLASEGAGLRLPSMSADRRGVAVEEAAPDRQQAAASSIPTPGIGYSMDDYTPPYWSFDGLSEANDSDNAEDAAPESYITPWDFSKRAGSSSDKSHGEYQSGQSPDVATEKPGDERNMERATSVADGLRVAFERIRLSWNYLEAQARRFINGEQRQGEEYGQALQRVIEAGIDSDEKLQQQMDSLAKSPRLTDNKTAMALLSVKRLREEGIGWNEIPSVLQQKAQTPGEATHDVEEISRRYSELPTTEGAATVADIGANIIGAALPVTLAAAIAPKAAAAVGAGVVVSDIATTIADAQMTVDAYERRTGEKVSDTRRNMYVTAATATNVLMDVLLNSSVLGKALPKNVGDLADKLMAEMMSSPVAQAEFNGMTRHVLQREARVYADQVTGTAVSGAMTGGALEAEQSIYSGEFPEMERIMNSIVGGFVMGGVAGSAHAGVRAYDTHRKRYEDDNIYYASRTEGAYKERFPMSEIRNIKYKGGDATIAGDVYSADGEITRRDIPIDNIVTGSYREAVKGKSIAELMQDNYKIPKKKLNDYRNRWEKLRKSDSHKAAMEQNEILQEVAASMGVPIKVYKRFEDLPESVKANKESRNAVGLTVGDRDIYLVLSMCNYLNFDGVLSTIRHELVGHRGLPRLYETEQEYYRELDRVGPTIVKEQNAERRMTDPAWQDLQYRPTPEARKAVEESFSRTAEKRRYDKRGHTGSEGLKDPTLRRSDRNMRNATVNEQRAGIEGTEWAAKKDKKDSPMPTILDIERERRPKRKK